MCKRKNYIKKKRLRKTSQIFFVIWGMLRKIFAKKNIDMIKYFLMNIKQKSEC